MSITGRIMRKENYMIALLNQELVPTLNGYLTHLLEWMLNNTVIDDVLEHTFSESQRSREKAMADIRKKCLVAGFLGLLLLPYLSLLLILYLFYRYTEVLLLVYLHTNIRNSKRTRLKLGIESTLGPHTGSSETLMNWTSFTNQD
jgi:ATP/ADP translocase